MAIQYQSLNFKGRKGMSAGQSREHQRAWSEKAWNMALAKGNFDRSREHLNFEIVGGKIQPIDKSKSIGQRLAENLAGRGIKDPNANLAEPRYRTIGDFVFSGSHDRMTELAFGKQPVVIKPGDNKENQAIHREPEIEQWAMDIYNFVCGKYSKENVISFYVHLDETTPHAHAAVVPVKNGKIDFKGVFVGKDKMEYSQHISALHDELSEVNKPWGLQRGTSLTNRESRGRQTFDYRRQLEHDSRQKEADLAEAEEQLSAASHNLKVAETRIKGLTSMIAHLEERKSYLEKDLAELRRKMNVTAGDRDALQKQIDEKLAAIAEVEASLADKNAKLEKANEQLEEARVAKEDVQHSQTVLQQEVSKLSKAVYSSSGTLVKEQMLNMVIGEFKQIRESLPPEQLAAFNDSYLAYLADRGNEMLHCGVLLFAQLVNDATTFAEGHGGGSGGSDLKWGRDDNEDDRQWARRCVAMANRMMRPSGHGRKR